ncbi:MAG: SGNH/GDSL hydrolase family protein [Rhodospirillales bacterium]|nr:SGNH/GDSL hydrolase family protein [Rhodospirillales bacterium]
MLTHLGKGTSPLVKQRVIDTTAKTIALLGDSITKQNTSDDGRAYLPEGYASMLNAITGQRYTFPTSHNLGVSSDNISEINARITDLASLSPAPDLVFVLAGTNDITSSTTEAAMISGMQSIYDYITGTLGAKVIALTILPRNQNPSGAPLSAADQTKLENVNNWILSQGSDDIIPVNTYDNLSDGMGNPDSQYFNKQGDYGTTYVHPNPTGALVIARDIAARLKFRFGVYDIPDMTQNNLLNNPDLSGTGGTLTGAGVSGVVSDDFRLYSFDEGTTVGSKPTDTQQKIVSSYSNNTTYDKTRFHELSDMTSGYTPGDDVVGEAEIEVLSGSRIEGVWMQLTDKGGSNLNYSCLSKYQDPEFPSENQTYYLRTPVVTTQGDSTALQLIVYAEMNSADGESADVSFIVKQMRCRVV